MTDQQEDTTPVVTVRVPELEELCSFLRTSIIFSALVFTVVLVMSACTSYGLDDTDDRNTGTRSGLTLRTDHGTGCQYLVQRELMIARVDGSGKHVGCR